ncbi:hypothetical protein BGW42_003955 [Actinomortierella wolfii]|nr:hypothetical protein BGW42_003955 [Actinomortierella wolfii]
MDIARSPNQPQSYILYPDQPLRQPRDDRDWDRDHHQRSQQHRPTVASQFSTSPSAASSPIRKNSGHDNANYYPRRQNSGHDDNSHHQQQHYQGGQRPSTPRRQGSGYDDHHHHQTPVPRRQNSSQDDYHHHYQQQRAQSPGGPLKSSGSSGSAVSSARGAGLQPTASSGSNASGRHRPSSPTTSVDTFGRGGSNGGGGGGGGGSGGSSLAYLQPRSSSNDTPTLGQPTPRLTTPKHAIPEPITPPPGKVSFSTGLTPASADEHDLDHERQARQYQQKLQQRPPSKKTGDDDDDDDSGADSDSSSMLSYRRSISRVSMSFRRGNNVPNISLFAPGQRPNYGNTGGSSTGVSSSGNQRPLYNNSGATLAQTSSQRMIQEQREERLRQQQQQPGFGTQQQQQQQQQYGSASSLASIDHASSSASNGNNYKTQQHYQNGGMMEIRIPERNSSADAYSPKGTSSPSYSHNRQGASPTSPHPHQQHQLPSARPSYESTHTDRSGRSQHNHHPSAGGGGAGNGGVNSGRSNHLNPGDARNVNRARSPGPGRNSPGPGSGAGLVYQQNFQMGMGGAGSSRLGGAGSEGLRVNPHPAHHLAQGGYIRPEEAVGPSNPTPEKAEDFVRQGIELHEVGEIAKATHFFKQAAELGDPVGMLMYGLSVRHGWGCQANRPLAFQYLQKSAEHAVGDLKSRDSFASTAAKGELVLAIYELGICFRHGWGVEKNKKTAAYYFEIAANLGDPDAQNDLAWCYYHGVGVKKDMYKSAKYYRLAAAQGLETVGNSWIWKDKYGGAPTSPVAEKAQ